MMRLSYIVLLVFLNVGYIQSQNKRDSLERLLKNTKSDQKKVDLYEELGTFLESDSTELAYIFYEKGIELAKKINYQKGIVHITVREGYINQYFLKIKEAEVQANTALKISTAIKYDNGTILSYNLLGEISLSKSKPNECKVFFQNAFDLSRKINDTTLIILGLDYLAGCDKRDGKKDSALVKHKTSLLLSTLSNNTQKRGVTLNNIALLYRDHGDLESAIKYFREAIHIWSKIPGTDDLIGTSLSNLGTVFYNNKDYDQAINYFSQSLAIAKKLNHSYMIATAYNNIAGTLLKIKKYKEALSYYETCLELINQIGNPVAIASTLNNIGNTYGFLNEYDKALDYIKRSLVIKEKIGLSVGLADAHNSLGKIYLNTKQFQLAYNEFQQGLTLARKASDLQYISRSLFGLSKSCAQLGKYADAYRYQSEYIVIEDSLMTSEKSRTVSDMEAKYQNDKKSLEIDNLHKSEKLQEEELARKELEVKRKNTLNIAFVIGFVLIGIIAIIAIRNYRIKEKSNKIIFKQKAEVEKQKAIIEEKQKEILDSIHYAHRIQVALIASDKYITKNLQRLKKS